MLTELFPPEAEGTSSFWRLCATVGSWFLSPCSRASLLPSSHGLRLSYGQVSLCLLLRRGLVVPRGAHLANPGSRPHLKTLNLQLQSPFAMDATFLGSKG